MTAMARLNRVMADGRMKSSGIPRTRPGRLGGDIVAKGRTLHRYPESLSCVRLRLLANGRSGDWGSRRPRRAAGRPVLFVLICA